MKEKIITLYKNLGETPLACLDRFRLENPEYKDETLSYVGRLDPMAEGLLLVAVGEENKNREQYTGLDKEYECEILFGFETDSYDLLGLITERGNVAEKDKIKIKTKKALPEFSGKFMQQYPPYSSKTLSGISLFVHARAGTLDMDKLPSHEVSVDAMEEMDWKCITGEDLLLAIKEKIGRVSGDFRQKEIISKWEEVLENKKEVEFPVVSLRISCGSGFYVRTFAHDLGRKVGLSACVFSIKRTRVGEYRI